MIRNEHVFRDVDGSGVAPALALYLEAVAARPEVRALHDRAVALLAPRPGERMLEVGCGLGADARELAAMVAPGEVVATDLSTAMLTSARERHDPALPVTYEHADVTDLPYEDASFDVVRVERVLQHVADVERACAEMARVLRPGGRLLAVDTDWGSFALDLAERDLVERCLAHAYRRFVSPRAALGLRRHLVGAGLADVSIEPFAFCYTSVGEAATLVPMVNDGIPAEADFVPAADREAWFAALRAADAAGTFTVGWTAYLAVAHKR
ncbi:MAG TPA: methyltransferase domain-containing protein [Mycobacteriales bacterium]|jgi:SAM-dependent methyltransferase|nr:methyltransferase domain-containing protein [Mycobacteriales bacterium]